MAKRSEIPLRKHTMNFFEGDIEWLQDRFPASQVSVFIRKLIRKEILRLKQMAAERVEQEVRQ